MRQKTDHLPKCGVCHMAFGSLNPNGTIPFHHKVQILFNGLRGRPDDAPPCSGVDQQPMPEQKRAKSV